MPDALDQERRSDQRIPGNLKAPFVATRDIAAVASRLLLDREWTGQDSLAVLDPEDISFEDMAEILTEVLARPVRFVQGIRDNYKQGFLSRAYSDAMAQGMVDMDIAKEHGLDNVIPAHTGKRQPHQLPPVGRRRTQAGIQRALMSSPRNGQALTWCPRRSLGALTAISARCQAA